METGPAPPAGPRSRHEAERDDGSQPHTFHLERARTDDHGVRDRAPDLLPAPLRRDPVRNSLQQLRHADRRRPRRGAQGRGQPPGLRPGGRLPRADQGLGRRPRPGEAPARLPVGLEARLGRGRDGQVPLRHQPALVQRGVRVAQEHDHGASRMNVLRRSERGQAMVLTVFFSLALLGMAALVLDVGSWFRAHRNLQATADAAALAGAQALPTDPGQASALASQYASKNQPALAGMSVNFASDITSNDTIKVHVQKPAEGLFSKVFGIDTVDEGASATARVEGMKSALYVAPIVVNKKHPMLNNCGGPCYGPNYSTTIPVAGTGAPGAFGLVNLDPASQGTTGASTLARWIENGFDKYLDIGG